MIATTQPSWNNGFARSQAEAAYPRLWDGLVSLGMPALGVTRSDLIYCLAGCRKDGVPNNMDASNWVRGDPRIGGPALDFSTDEYIDLPVLLSHFDSRGTFVIHLRLDTHIPAGDDSGSWEMGQSSSASHYPWTTGTIYSDTFRNDRVTGDAGLIANRTQWHQVAVTNEPGAGNWKFWQNAEVAFSAVGESPIYLAPNPEIGRCAGSYYLDGQVAWWGLWNRVLRPGELRFLWKKPLAIVQPRARRLGATEVEVGREYPITYQAYPGATGKRTWQAKPV